MTTPELCLEKHKQIDDKLEEHSRRITEHGKEIDILKESNAIHNVQIETLCKKIEELVKTIDKFTNILIGTVITGFIGGAIGLIFHFAQKGLGG